MFKTIDELCINFVCRKTTCYDLIGNSGKCPSHCQRYFVSKKELLSSTIVDQIIKELKYAEKCHPNQNLSKVETIDKAIAKLRKIYDSNKACGSCTTCSDSEKFICSTFATIAILIRGIECEIKNSDIFKNRNEFFKKELEEPIVNKVKESTENFEC
jgi:hypothetical protein